VDVWQSTNLGRALVALGLRAPRALVVLEKSGERPHQTHFVGWPRVGSTTRWDILTVRLAGEAAERLARVDPRLARIHGSADRLVAENLLGRSRIRHLKRPCARTGTYGARFNRAMTSTRTPRAGAPPTRRRSTRYLRVVSAGRDGGDHPDSARGWHRG